MKILPVTNLIAAIVLLWPPSPASAHLVTTGMGPVYDGIGHLLLTPEDLVPVLALALYAGLRGAITGRRILFLLPLAWFAGGLAGSAVSAQSPVPSAGHIISFPRYTGSRGFADAGQHGCRPGGRLGLVHGFFNGSR